MTRTESNQIDASPIVPEIVGPEAFNSGEYRFIANLVVDDENRPHDISVETPSNYVVLQNLKAYYGEEAVATGNAYDQKTETASGIPGIFGVYVTKTAFDAINSREK